MWTLGTIVTIIITRSEDKGGIIGKAAGVAQARINKRKAEIAAINRDIGNQMGRFERPGSHVGGNANTLDLRNRNAQDGKSPTGDKQQQQKTSNQSAGVEQEINNLKSNISGWQSEIQRLEQQLLEKEGRLKEHERSNREMIQTLRESGRADETRARELEEHGRQATMPLFSETVSLHNRIKWLKDSIWSGNNKLIELERKAGTLKMEAAKSGG